MHQHDGSAVFVMLSPRLQDQGNAYRAFDTVSTQTRPVRVHVHSTLADIVAVHTKCSPVLPCHFEQSESKFT